MFVVLVFEQYLCWSKIRISEKAKNSSYYSYQFVAYDGTPLSSQKGDLKLSYHPVYVYDNMPNQKHSSFTIDGKGNRLSAIDESRHFKEKNKTILISGGSTAFGTGLPSDKDTFSSHLQSKLAGLTVVNQAVIGHSITQEMLKSLIKGIDINPQVTISISGWNDFTQISQTMNPRGYVGFGEWTQLEFRLKKMRNIEHPSIIEKIYFFFKEILFKELNERFAQILKNSKDEVPSITIDEIVMNYVSTVLKYKKMMNSHGSDFLLVIQPDYNTLDSKLRESWQVKKYEEFRMAVTKALKSYKVDYIDLNEYHTSFHRNMFLDAIHLNSRGNERMVDLVLENLPDRLNDIFSEN